MITADRQTGSDRTVREFVEGFARLKGSAKQKAALEAVDLARAPLSSLLAPGGQEFDHDKVRHLLTAMRWESKQIQPPALGVVGKDHLETRLAGLIHPESFQYKKVLSLEGGLPHVVEVAFGVLRRPSSSEHKRRLITGANWSAAWVNPFRQLADVSLDAVLQERRMGANQPIAMLVHVARPRIEYADRGKSSVVLTKPADVLDANTAVGKRWTRQIKAEERSASARARRENAWKSRGTSLKDICYGCMEKAYLLASGGTDLPTHWRQVFYVIRPICDADPRSDRVLTDTTFKGIIDAYVDTYEPGWDIVRGARGVLKEPFTGRQIPLGTLAVRGYLGGEQPSGELGELDWMYPTHGARNRIAAVLICEKEGFDALLQHERIDRRYDLALANTKGISSKASRQLAREIGVPCFTLHDFDKNGFVMAGTLNGAVDMGLRLEDVEEWGLRAEAQTHENVYAAYINLLENGATEEEAEFISEGERVELNMLSSPDFVGLVENKLKVFEV